VRLLFRNARDLGIERFPGVGSVERNCLIAFIAAAPASRISAGDRHTLRENSFLASELI
jgi:hypothetical protein